MRLAHPVYGDVIRAGISALRERGIAGSLAEVIEAAGWRRREDTLRLASLRLASGGGSAGLLAAGALAARGRHDHSLAERLARAAITEGAGFNARFVAAEAAHFQGRLAQAERELAALAADAASDAERARVALLRFDNTWLFQGHEADLQLIDEAAGAITDPSWRDELLARRFWAMTFFHGPRAVAALLQPSHSGPLTAAHTSAFYGLARLGRLDDVIQQLSLPAAGAAIPAPDERWEQWALFVTRVAALVWAGHMGEAEERLTRAHGLVIGQPAAEARAYVAGWFAVLHLVQGRPVSAFRRASESYILFLQLGRTFAARWPCIAAAQAAAVTGQADRAAETLAVHDALGLPKVLINETEVLQARAWAAAAAGDLPGARAQLEAAADLGEQIGDLIGAASALHGVQKAARLLARCEGAVTPPVRAIGARVWLTPGELDTAVQAAAGGSNKQIADHLHVSVRTVESHLQRAYEKLGISGRRELADALRDRPDP